jgi:hypothetical protein
MAKKTPAKDAFAERCRDDPQGVIEDLLAQVKRQAQDIHRLNRQIEELKHGDSARK